ncbi:hypothetical protein N7468_004887 [Penicillium chermesinum]|uniref:chitinase n=1 Tax=Penicillium chermesinum TaxID=63820 RepID=A0A9W9PBM1_9EURO|nr:uncharacterized protein N7468_004887 [Penicillium chermesinum]KAJ5240268.1 hypothetical protein N7468_004887 [Penicillium chermesinum]KAJ6167136.1 hypothetical protein N7470_002583 [Penicillium chermesinum]
MRRLIAHFMGQLRVPLVAVTKAVIVVLEMTIVERIVSPTVTMNRSALYRNHVPKDAATNLDFAAWDPTSAETTALQTAKESLNVILETMAIMRLTEEFCGKKKVKRPSCSKSQDLRRVIGYYEGWSPDRPCHAFYPDQIPIGVYTHLNYAFASIDPESFEVLAANDYEKTLMKRLTNLKKSDPDLKVFIAVGGWTFNDQGPTRTVFSDIARSESNQRKFFNSLKTFMTEYDFDGIDLDWEYPAADDRGGREEDFKNFPKFLSNLKKALSDSGRDGLSITLPASYWYLQHFDLENLYKHVDFFNIMSYDLHGKWDLGNDWLDPVLNSHTNLTEITNALDLIWRNNVPSDKVVLGLAFYARVFSAADPSCMVPGCPFVSGGNPGICSDEVGILLNSEISDIMDKQQISSKLDKDAAVKTLKFNTDQWLTYDNGDTFKLKTDFARSECLGGVMVWAVSHDLPQGNLSRILGETVGRKVKSLQLDMDKGSLEVKKTHLQCRWSNCFEGCPTGWTPVSRTDPGARTDEKMWDNTGCGGVGQHTFCCPPDSELPKCGWYTHNNGNCDSQCPSGYVEVGSNFKYCSNNKNDYQAACCTKDTDSMKLYSQCDWAGHAPDCDKGECSSGQSLLVSSSTGSGGNYCHATKVKYTMNGNEGTEWQERKYCCDDDTDSKWEDCEWYDDIGMASADGIVDGYCHSGCPNDRVRIAMDQHGGGCKGDGGRARCCLAKYITKRKRSYTDAESTLEKNVKAFMADPDCGTDAYIYKRDLEGLEFVDMSADAFNHSSRLERRFNTKPYEAMHNLVLDLGFYSTGSAADLEIWNKHVVSEYPDLTIKNMHNWLNSDLKWRKQGEIRTADKIICDMAIFNAKFGGKSKAISCACTSRSCCTSDDPGLCAGEDLDGNAVADPEKRDLSKRAGPRDYEVELPNGIRVEFRSVTYPSRGDWAIGNPIWSMAFEYEDDDDCLNADIATAVVTVPAGREDYDVEHILELNTIPEFLEDAANGVLPTGTILETFGSLQITNNVDFVVLIKALNGLKSRIWRSDVYHGDMGSFIDQDTYKDALQRIRSVISVFHYLNDRRVHSRMVHAANLVRSELALADQEWMSMAGYNPRGQDWWDQWFREQMRFIGQEARNWVNHWISEMRKFWAVRTGRDATYVNEVLDSYKRLASDMDIDLQGLEGNG